jgi:lysophospholipase L1-like esterase
MTVSALILSAALAATPIHWQGSWAAAQQIPEPGNALTAADLTDTTLREIVHASVGGTGFRVRLSNAFGKEPLTLDAVHVAQALSPAAARIDPATDHILTFNGQPGVTIPAGAEYWSDPLDAALPAQSDIAISLHYIAPPEQQTSHPGSRATSYIVHGDHTADADLADAKRVDHWFNLSGLDVVATSASIITLGDSITDGHGATTNGNDRWPDVLGRRTAPQGVGVLNVGIGGGRVLQDGLGPNATARFDRDVLSQTDARYVIVFEGINDIGTLTRDAPVDAATHADFVARMETAYDQMIQSAHDHGLTIYGATILPFFGSDYYHPDAANEADRQALNAWIRDPAHYDGVIDFDALMRDPSHPGHLRAEYDSGDHLHPNAAGYRAMGESVPLAMFDADAPAPDLGRLPGHRRRKKG